VVPLLIKHPVADLAQPVDEDHLGQRIPHLPLFSPACTRQRSSTFCNQSKMNSVRLIRSSSRSAITNPFWHGYSARTRPEVF